MRDSYVAAMKGVIASRTDVVIHDLSHAIAAFDVWEGAWFLRNVFEYWPVGTIFVCVIDPGVGTSRKIVAMEKDGRIFLAPDNGLLTFIGEGRAFAVTNDALFLPNGRNTFHGRDRFAPVAAALANGLAIEEVGEAIVPMTLRYDAAEYCDDVVRGTIVAMDRFGNAITDIERARVRFAPFALKVRDMTIDRLEENYGDALPGAFLIVGSSGHLEISIANDSAAAKLELRRLEPVTLLRLPV